MVLKSKFITVCVLTGLVLSGCGGSGESQITPSAPATKEAVATVEETAAALVASTEATEATEEPEEDNAPIREKYKADIVVASNNLIKRFLPDCKVPLATKLWTVADFDEKGAIMATAEIEVSGETKKVMTVLTLEIEDGNVKSAKPHYIAVDDKILGNDGYCDEVFELLEKASEAVTGQ